MAPKPKRPVAKPTADAPLSSVSGAPGRREGMKKPEAVVAAVLGGRCLTAAVAGPKHKLEWKCAAGHRWAATLPAVLGGRWCTECDKKRNALPDSKAHSTYVDALLQAQPPKSTRSRFRSAGGPEGHLGGYPSNSGTAIVYRLVCEYGHVWSATMAHLRAAAIQTATAATTLRRPPWCPVCSKADTRYDRITDFIIDITGIAAVSIHTILDYLDIGQIVFYNTSPMLYSFASDPGINMMAIFVWVLRSNDVDILPHVVKLVRTWAVNSTTVEKFLHSAVKGCDIADTDELKLFLSFVLREFGLASAVLCLAVGCGEASFGEDVLISKSTGWLCTAGPRVRSWKTCTQVDIAPAEPAELAASVGATTVGTHGVSTDDFTWEELGLDD